MKVKVFKHGMDHGGHCSVCGDELDTEFATAAILTDDADNFEQALGYICNRCMNINPVDSAYRCFTRFEGLQEWADSLFELSNLIKTIPASEWNKSDELKARESEGWENYKKENNIPDDWPGIGQKIEDSEIPF